MRGFASLCIGIVLVIWTITAIFFGGLWYTSYRFDVNCGGHLKRAADANSVKLADQELGIALNYIEYNKLTEGNTSIIFSTPANDLEFWYDNLVESKLELEQLSRSEETGAIDNVQKTNALIKLRETLLDHDNEGEEVTMPKGVAYYPYRGLLMIVGIALSILSLIGGGFFKAAVDDL